MNDGTMKVRCAYVVWFYIYLIKCTKAKLYDHNYLKTTNEMEAGPDQQVVQLREFDVPGTSLDELMDKHSIAALKRWLLCHGIEMSSSVRKR